MSDKEFSRLGVLLEIEAGRVTVENACALLGLRRRQAFRLLAGLRERGAASLVSQRRGRTSNRRLPAVVRDLTMAIVKARYADFGPTFAAEKPAGLHACYVSRETLRKWMIEDGLWRDRKHRLPSVHQPRNRRERVGDLVQIDGSKHFWFEDRGLESTLIAYIDDAIMHAAFRDQTSSVTSPRPYMPSTESHGRLGWLPKTVPREPRRARHPSSGFRR